MALAWVTLLACRTGPSKLSEDPATGPPAGEPRARAGASPVRSHVEEITGSPAPYAVSVGGTLDAFNTMQLGHQVTSRFEPNLSLTIENVGDTVVRGPRIVVDGRRDWSSVDSILGSLITPGMTDEEKTFAVWNFVRENVQEGHSYKLPLFGAHPTASVTRFMNALGTGACGTFHSIMPLLLIEAGVDARPGYVSFGAHATQKEQYGGRDHYFDAMLPTGDEHQPRGHFPLALDNRTIPGVDCIRQDRYLIDRCGVGPEHFRNVAYWGRDCNFWPAEYHDPHDMTWTLRPGERITLDWRPCARPWARLRKTESLKPGPGNGSVSYTPPAVPPDGIVEMRSPYPIVGGTIEGTFHNGGRVAFTFDEGEWIPLWQGSGVVRVELPDDRPELREPVYTTRLRLRCEGLAKPPTVTVLFQTYLRSLASLAAGTNRVRYEDDSEGPRHVRITHRWRESSAWPVPGASPGPIRGRESAGTFRWKQPESGPEPAAWEFFLSPRRDLSRPLMASFHVVIEGEPVYTVGHFGAFNPQQRYYWRVRARSADGVWGHWSDTWTFRADVPPQPTDLRVTEDGTDHHFLSWSWPGRRESGLRFEVYASNEDGFTPRREQRSGDTLSPPGRLIELPANLAAVTTEMRIEITQIPAAFFRVATINGENARSTPSVCVAAPHPKVLPAPLPPARVGEPYRAPLPCRYNAGHWIVNIRPDLPRGVIRHGADRLRFGMVAGPDWLQIDPATGKLSGTPTPADIGTQDLFVEVYEGNGRGHSTRLVVEVRGD